MFFDCSLSWRWFLTTSKKQQKNHSLQCLQIPFESRFKQKIACKCISQTSGCGIEKCVVPQHPEHHWTVRSDRIHRWIYMIQQEIKFRFAQLQCTVHVRSWNKSSIFWYPHCPIFCVGTLLRVYKVRILVYVYMIYYICKYVKTVELIYIIAMSQIPWGTKWDCKIHQCFIFVSPLYGDFCCHFSIAVSGSLNRGGICDIFVHPIGSFFLTYIPHIVLAN